MKLLKLHLPLLLRSSLGICYVWFGALKFFTGASPAESIAKNTIDRLVLGFVPGNTTILLLAVWEVLIGIGLFANIYSRFVIGAALLHMALTFTPFLFFPSLCVEHSPFGLSLLGQYILKNLVLVCAFIYLYPEKKG